MKFTGNLISILARGDQEMFHSAFFAWLLKRDESHGLGRMFLDRVLQCLPPEFSEGLSGEYDVKTEFSYKNARFDILVHPEKDTKAGLVIENKFKGFGYLPQIEKYDKSQKYKVAIFSLLGETLAEEISRDKVIEYSKLLGIIMEIMPLAKSPDDYRFVIIQYAEFLKHTLSVFEIFKEFFEGKLDQSTFQQKMRDVPIADVTNNDCRTFSYFYYHHLAQHLKRKEPNLWFGEAKYEERGNTRWLYEKNMLGAPFMEAVIRDIGILEKWAIRPDEIGMLFESGADITPRLEMSLNPLEIIKPEHRIGDIMLGTGNKNLQRKLKAMTTTFKGKRKATRNFHREDITIQDLPYTKMTNRLHQILEKILIFNGA